MPYQNNNEAYGIPTNSPYQVGKSNVDNPTPTLEDGLLLPWPSDPDTSWVYFDWGIECMLDSGMVVHNRLPQINRDADTLAPLYIDNPNFSSEMYDGVNLKCQDQYTDIMQRMGHARYWFRLYGKALRIGYKVPIPKIKTIGGVPAIPYDNAPQFAFNRIFPGGNYSGAVLWHAEWSLWYTTLVPPTDSKDIPAVDFAAHIDGTIDPPISDGVQSPFSQPDDNAVPSAPPQQLEQPLYFGVVNNNDEN